MPQKPRKTPERHCVGCGNPFPKHQLIRIVKTPDNSIVLDLTGKRSGRGAYLCHNSECLKKARKAKRVERSLDIGIPDQIYDSLEREMNHYDRNS